MGAPGLGHNELVNSHGRVVLNWTKKKQSCPETEVERRRAVLFQLRDVLEFSLNGIKNVPAETSAAPGQKAPPTPPGAPVCLIGQSLVYSSPIAYGAGEGGQENREGGIICLLIG